MEFPRGIDPKHLLRATAAAAASVITAVIPAYAESSVSADFTVPIPEDGDNYLRNYTLFYVPYSGPGLNFGFSRRLFAEVQDIDGLTRVGFQALIAGWDDQLNSHLANVSAISPSLEAGVSRSVSVSTSAADDICSVSLAVDGEEVAAASIFRAGCEFVDVDPEAQIQIGTPPPGAGGISGFEFPGEVRVSAPNE